MIKGFAHKGLEAFFETGSKAGILPSHAKRLHMVLCLLNGANRAEDMNFPGSGFHGLSGNLGGSWSVKISGNWRLLFRFEGQDAYEINYVDYH
jgi:toxin HigB-1